MLAGAGRELELRLALADGPLRDRLRAGVRVRGAVPGRLDGAGGAGPGDVARAARHPGHRQHLPAPGVLAKQATTVDHISGGRLIFGIGAGWHEYESQAFGLPLPPVKERMDRLEEAAHLIKRSGRRTGRRSRASTTRSTSRRTTRRTCSSRTRRSSSAAAARSGRCRSSRSTPTCANVSGHAGGGARTSSAVLDEHCAETGRDPKTIKRTIQVPLFLTDDPAFKERVAAGDGGDARQDAGRGGEGGPAGQRGRGEAAGRGLTRTPASRRCTCALWPRLHMRSRAAVLGRGHPGVR